MTDTDTGSGTDRWARLLDDLAHQRTELDRVRTALADAQARATSHDKLISVTVDARGLLTDLHIAPAALRRYRADALSQTITELVCDADATLRTQRERLLAGVAQASPGYADLRSRRP